MAYTLYSTGNLSLTVAISIATAINFNIAWGAVFGGLIFIGCFVLVLRLQSKFNSAPHVVHGFASGKNGESLDVSVQLAEIEKLALKAAHHHGTTKVVSHQINVLG